VGDDLDRARQRRQRRGAKVGAFGPGGRKQARIDRVMAKVDAAAERRAIEAGERPPTPERITLALDFAGLEGPEVDRALGGEEPMVDEWEAGTRVPSLEQVKALAKLTGWPVKFFYLPAPPPITGGLICGADGCQPLGEVPPRG
jgi:hypothetical protein